MTKTDGGAEYPASAYAYVPDPQEPSTWKIRLWETPETKVTVAQLGRAAAALSPGGFRGEKVQIPAGDLAKVKARIRSEYSKLKVKPDDMPESVAASEPDFTTDLTRIALGENAESVVRIPIAMIGTFFKGTQKFTIGTKDIASMAANFAKRGGDVVLDYEHASEFPEVAAGGPVPAAGWIIGVDGAPDANGIAWADVKFTQQARELIAAKEYKYISPVINWGARDKSTGDPQGATLSSAALTNRPVLDRMPAISLSDAGWQANQQQGEVQIEMAKNDVMCSEHPRTPLLCPKCDADEISQLSASEHQHQHQAPKVISLSDVKRDGTGRLDVASIPAGESVSGEVLVAFERQRIALGEVDAAIQKGKIKPALKDQFTKIALSDIENFRSLVKEMPNQVDLTEHGHGGEGVGTVNELAGIEAKFAERTKALMKEEKLPHAQAFKMALSENPEAARRRTVLNRERMAAGVSVDEEGDN